MATLNRIVGHTRDSLIRHNLVQSSNNHNDWAEEENKRNESDRSDRSDDVGVSLLTSRNHSRGISEIILLTRVRIQNSARQVYNLIKPFDPSEDDLVHAVQRVHPFPKHLLAHRPSTRTSRALALAGTNAVLLALVPAVGLLIGQTDEPLDEPPGGGELGLEREQGVEGDLESGDQRMSGRVRDEEREVGVEQ